MTEKIYWILEGGKKSTPFKDLSADEILSPVELVRWREMRFEKRQREFLIGRYTAKRLLTSGQMPWTNESFSSLQILNEAEGAPYLDRPGNPGCLSISHRADSAAAVYYLGRDRQVGIDLEVIEPRDWSFVEDFFTSGEAQFAYSLVGLQQRIWITLVWSAKEAILKAWRQGLRIDTRGIEIQPGSEMNLSKLEQDWVLIDSKSKITEYPPCWLFGRVFGDKVITLAVSSQRGEMTSDAIDLVRVFR